MFCEFIIAYKISFVNSKLLFFNNFFLKFSFRKFFSEILSDSAKNERKYK